MVIMMMTLLLTQFADNFCFLVRGASAQNVDLVTFDVIMRARENVTCDFSPMKLGPLLNSR